MAENTDVNVNGDSTDTDTLEEQNTNNIFKVSIRDKDNKNIAYYNIYDSEAQNKIANLQYIYVSIDDFNKFLNNEEEGSLKNRIDAEIEKQILPETIVKTVNNEKPGTDGNIILNALAVNAADRVHANENGDIYGKASTIKYGHTKYANNNKFKEFDPDKEISTEYDDLSFNVPTSYNLLKSLYRSINTDIDLRVQSVNGQKGQVILTGGEIHLNNQSDSPTLTSEIENNKAEIENNKIKVNLTDITADEPLKNITVGGKTYSIDSSASMNASSVIYTNRTGSEIAANNVQEALDALDQKMTESKVVGNPTEEASDSLNKIKIGDITYKVEGGGSGGGSTVTASETGTSQDIVNYITIDDKEYKIGGSGGGGTSGVESIEFWKGKTPDPRSGRVLIGREDILYYSQTDDLDDDKHNPNDFVGSIIFQYVGETNEKYTFGYFYHTVYDIETGNNKWEQVNVQPSSGESRGSVVSVSATGPATQTDKAKFITIDDETWEIESNSSGGGSQVSVSKDATPTEANEAAYITIDNKTWKIHSGSEVEANLEGASPANYLQSIKINEDFYSVQIVIPQEELDTTGMLYDGFTIGDISYRTKPKADEVKINPNETLKSTNIQDAIDELTDLVVNGFPKASESEDKF